MLEVGGLLIIAEPKSWLKPTIYIFNVEGAEEPGDMEDARDLIEAGLGDQYTVRLAPATWRTRNRTLWPIRRYERMTLVKVHDSEEDSDDD